MSGFVDVISGQQEECWYGDVFAQLVPALASLFLHFVAIQTGATHRHADGESQPHDEHESEAREYNRQVSTVQALPHFLYEYPGS